VTLTGTSTSVTSPGNSPTASAEAQKTPHPGSGLAIRPSPLAYYGSPHQIVNGAGDYRQAAALDPKPTPRALDAPFEIADASRNLAAPPAPRGECASPVARRS
jgi:hypothetical protein